MPPTSRPLALLSQMTLEEKVGQMVQLPGDRDRTQDELEELIRAGRVGSLLHVVGPNVKRFQELALTGSRLRIPLLFGVDAIHGHAFHGRCVCFPSQLASSGSWDEDLIRRVGLVTARDVRATGLHWTFSPVLCLARDPRWGRTDETFGEDGYLAGRLGAALISGLQDGLGSSAQADRPRGILACAKHFLAYGETVGARDSAEAEVSMRKALSTFAPAFEAAVQAGVRTVMAGYHAVDGTPMSANSALLKDVLVGRMGFTGFVVSDWNNCEYLSSRQRVCRSLAEASAVVANAGNHMIMNTPAFFEHCVAAVRSGAVPESVVDDAVLRILRAKDELGLLGDAVKAIDPTEAAVDLPGDRELALEVARAGLVLLTNRGGRLPLPLPAPASGQQPLRAAVVGPLADDPRGQLGDWTFVPGGPTTQVERDLGAVKTVARALAGEPHASVKVVPGFGAEDTAALDAGVFEEAFAHASDLVVVVLGDTLNSHGEEKDRACLDLPAPQQQLARAAFDLRDRGATRTVVVVLVSSKPLTGLGEIVARADALVAAWNPGQEGGQAVSDLIFGRFNPAGRLTISFPRTTGQIPVYHDQIPGWHGPGRYVDLDEAGPLFPFGFGLSFTTFALSDLAVELLPAGEGARVSVSVANTGPRQGSTVVQIYVTQLYSSVTVPIHRLRGFALVKDIAPGSTVKASVVLPRSAFSLINKDLQRVVEPGEFVIKAAQSSSDPQAQEWKGVFA